MNGTPASTRSTMRLAPDAIRTEERTIETVDFRTEAVATDALALRDTSGRTRRSHALELRAARRPSPARRRSTSERCPRAIASERDQLRAAAVNVASSISCSSTATEPWTVHAITSPRYARVHHDELAGRVLDLMAQHPAWHLPLGYKDGVFGAERVPSGAYLGDRDMFLFLVDGNRDLDDPTDARTLACSADSFSGTATSVPPPSPWMCSCSARSAAITSSGAFSTSPASGAGTWVRRFRTRGRRRSTSVRAALDADTAARSRRCSCGPRPRSSGRRATRCSRRPCSDSICRRSRPPRRTRWRKQYETNPRSVWGYVQGLTRLSQRTPWQDGRFTLDRAASRLLTTVH